MITMKVELLSQNADLPLTLKAHLLACAKHNNQNLFYLFIFYNSDDKFLFYSSWLWLFQTQKVKDLHSWLPSTQC